jgi:plastocyanin
MSKTAKRNLAGGSIAALFTLLIVIVVADPFSARGGTEPAVREIVLEAKDVVFGGDNPTIHAKPGERVRLIVRNSDPGILHSISVPGIDSEVRHIRYGEEVVLDLTIPEGGSFQYVCPQHAPRMQGRIVVEP